jgi:hypothetical protein
MHSLLLAAGGWNDFLRLVPFVIAFLVWVIGRFASQVPQKPPQRGVAAPRPNPPQPPKPAGDPLQTEINEFLRQAQAAREGRAAPKPDQARPAAAQSGDMMTPSSGRPGDVKRQRPSRRPPGAQPRRDSGREETRTTARPLARPVVVEVARARPEPKPPARESVAQHVAETLDSSKFSKRATQLSQVQESTDADFRQHMQRVFQHDLGTLPKEASGIFEAAGAAANAATAALAAKASAAAAGAESGTAPVATYKHRSDIALFLAGRKNMRDAIILTEILQRPEHRW